MNVKGAGASPWSSPWCFRRNALSEEQEAVRTHATQIHATAPAPPASLTPPPAEVPLVEPFSCWPAKRETMPQTCRTTHCHCTRESSSRKNRLEAAAMRSGVEDLAIDSRPGFDELCRNSACRRFKRGVITNEHIGHVEPYSREVFAWSRNLPQNVKCELVVDGVTSCEGSVATDHL